MPNLSGKPSRYSDDTVKEVGRHKLNAVKIKERIMASTIEVRDGGYRFIPGVAQYSAGVGALSGFAVKRMRFSRPIPLRDGFGRIEQHLKDVDRPVAALCACELRSPEPFTESGFKSFNEAYIGFLRRWRIILGDGNPIARSNVCPKIDPPSEPSFYAFSYPIPQNDAPTSFVIAGSAESPEGKSDYRTHVIRLGETDSVAMTEKARWVLGEMERRMAQFSATWSDTTAVQLYTVENIFSFLASELGRRGVLRHGLTWHLNQPPVVDLVYEMDCRRVHLDEVLDI
jgi:hypothetical protein